VPPFSERQPEALKIVSFEKIQGDGRVRSEDTVKSPYQPVLEELLNTARNLLRRP